MCYEHHLMWVNLTNVRFIIHTVYVLKLFSSDSFHEIDSIGLSWWSVHSLLQEYYDLIILLLKSFLHLLGCCLWHYWTECTLLIVWFVLRSVQQCKVLYALYLGIRFSKPDLLKCFKFTRCVLSGVFVKKWKQPHIISPMQ